MASNSERGSMALFGVLMAVVFMTVGGISIELWNVLSQRRQLHAVADAAATAGASAIDVDQYRLDGSLVLLPDLAQDRAASAIANSELAANDAKFRFSISPDEVTIEGSGQVDLIILGIIGADPIRLNVSAQAAPFQGN